MAKSTAKQNVEVLESLRKRRALGLTPKDALRFGCFRLAARVFDLRESGHNIVTHWEGDGERRYARYVLIHEHAA